MCGFTAKNTKGKVKMELQQIIMLITIAIYTAIVLSKTYKFTIFAIQYYTAKEVIILLNNLSCFMINANQA